jgi:putative ABC transport system permease protein
MTFLDVVTRSLKRRPIRTGLTLLGISVGIAAVVALIGLSRGLVTSWTAGMQERGTEIVVSNFRGSLTPKPFPASTRDRIANLPGVAATCTILVDLMSIETAELMIVSGREWGCFAWENLKLVSGRMPNDQNERAVVLGTNAADILKKKVGDTVQIETEELTVVGIANGGAFVENGSVILSLPLLQQITGNHDQISAIDVRVTPGMNDVGIRHLCDEMNKLIPEGRAEPAGEHIASSEGYRVINAMSWGTSLLAILVGVLGVTNTMLMSVFERKQEIAILLALGWRRSRIVRMIYRCAPGYHRRPIAENGAGSAGHVGAGFEDQPDVYGDRHCRFCGRLKRTVSGVAELKSSAEPGLTRMNRARKSPSDIL